MTSVAKKTSFLAFDENYIEFADKSLDNTLAGEVKNYENLFVIRSVTKFYGMAGIRFGYAVAAGTLLDKLETVRQPWSINGLAEDSYAGSVGRTRNLLKILSKPSLKNELRLQRVWTKSKVYTFTHP